MFDRNTIHRFSFPTDIRFGLGAKNEIPHYVLARKLKRPLIVTDAGLKDSQIVEDLRDMLEVHDLHAELYSEFSGDPKQEHVSLGVKGFRAHQADCILGIGGGAALDVAKSIALMTQHDGSILEYSEDHPARKPVTKPLPTFVLIPTTAGTGSEVGRSAVICDPNTYEKRVVFHPSLLAPLVIIDPDYTLRLPARITAATGMDALSHLVEAYLAKDFHPICDSIALGGLSIIENNFRQSFDAAKSEVHNDSSLIHRAYMMLAATMGAIAFQKGLGVTHSCAHALSSVCNTHHGLANGIMLPYTMAFNAKRIPEKFRGLCKTLELPTNESPKCFIEWLRELQRSVEIPTNLKEIGVGREHLASLVDFALKDTCHMNNPVKVLKNDFIQIFESAISGN